MADVTYRDKNGKFISKKRAKKLQDFQKFYSFNVKIQDEITDHNYSKPVNKLENKEEIHEDFLVSKSETKINDNNEYLLGRRVVDIHHMADQMVCEQCGTLIHLRDIISEKNYGLASVFTMLCRSCHTIRKISSGKRDGCGGFEINYKVTIGMSIKYKKGAYPKGHKVHDKRIFITYPIKTNPL